MSKHAMQQAFNALATVHRSDFDDDCQFELELCWEAMKTLKAELAKPDFICSECAYLGKSFGLTQESHCSKCIRHYELVDMFTQKKEL